MRRNIGSGRVEKIRVRIGHQDGHAAARVLVLEEVAKAPFAVFQQLRVEVSIRPRISIREQAATTPKRVPIPKAGRILSSGKARRDTWIRKSPDRISQQLRNRPAQVIKLPPDLRLLKGDR